MLRGSFILYVWRKSHLIHSFYLPTQNELVWCNFKEKCYLCRVSALSIVAKY